MSLSRLQWALLALAACGQTLIAADHLRMIWTGDNITDITSISVDLSTNAYNTLSTAVIFLIAGAIVVALWRNDYLSLMGIAVGVALAGAVLTLLLTDDQIQAWPWLALGAIGAAAVVVGRSRMGFFERKSAPNHAPYDRALERDPQL